MKNVIAAVMCLFSVSLSLEAQTNLSQEQILLTQYRILNEVTRYDNLIPFEVQQRIVEPYIPTQPLMIRPPIRPPFRPPVINNIKINNNITRSNKI